MMSKRKFLLSYTSRIFYERVIIFLVFKKYIFVLLLCYFWNRLQSWNSKICRVIRDWKIVLDRIGSARLVEIFKSRLLKQLPLIIVWLWRIPLGWTTLNCSLDQFLILLLIRRTSYHLLREDDLSTSFNISSVKIY